MPTETKVGLCVIAGLMIVFGVVIVRRVRQEFGHDATLVASQSISQDSETPLAATPKPEAAILSGSTSASGSDRHGASIAKSGDGDRSGLETLPTFERQPQRRPQPSSPPPRRSAAGDAMPVAGPPSVVTPLVPNHLTVPDARRPARFALNAPPAAPTPIPTPPLTALAEPPASFRSTPPNRVSFDRKHVQPTVHQQAIAQPESPPRPVAPAARDRHRQISGDGSSYVVRAGDTFFEIAREQLGDATRWVEIYELNQPGGDPLKPGMQILLPAGG